MFDKFLHLSSMYVPWRENSSASAFQPLRRFSSFQTKKRTLTTMSAVGRRYSYDNKILTHLSPTLLSKKLNGSPSPHHNSSLFTRGPGWQSQVEDTIDEDVETNSSIVLTYRPKYGMISRSVVECKNCFTQSLFNTVLSNILLVTEELIVIATSVLFMFHV